MESFGLKYDKEHYKRLENLYVKKIEHLYLSTAREAGNIARLIESGANANDPFSFSDYPQTKHRVDQLFKLFAANTIFLISKAVKTEWLESAKKNDILVDRVLKSTNFKKEQVEHLYSRNLEALEAFQKRKIKGLNLSDRVWKYTRQYKTEIEMAVDVALSDGRSAAELGRDVKQYLF